MWRILDFLLYILFYNISVTVNVIFYICFVLCFGINGSTVSACYVYDTDTLNIDQNE